MGIWRWKKRAVKRIHIPAHKKTKEEEKAFLTGPELKRKKCDGFVSVWRRRSFKEKESKDRHRQQRSECRAPRNRALKVEQDPHLLSQKQKEKKKKKKKKKKKNTNIKKTEHWRWVHFCSFCSALSLFVCSFLFAKKSSFLGDSISLSLSLSPTSIKLNNG